MPCHFTMGSQKAPGIVVLHCNGRTYCNPYAITFKIGLLRTHTRLLHRSCHCWKASLGILWSSVVAFDFCPTLLLNVSPWGPYSEQGTAKSHWERNPESAVVGWWHNKRRVARCRNHCPCLPLVAPLPLQNLHPEMTSNTRPGGTNSWCTKPLV
jgi:hypothetical protein